MADLKDALQEAGIDLDRMLQAWPAIEVGGAAGGVRYEPAYMPKGYLWCVQGRTLTGTGALFQNEMIAAWNDFGPDAASSRSRWQIMFCNAYRLGFRGEPRRLDVDEVALKFVRLLLAEIVEKILHHGQPLTIENILDCWNTGNSWDAYVPSVYIDRFKAEYDRLGQETP